MVSPHKQNKLTRILKMAIKLYLEKRDIQNDPEQIL